MNIIIQDENAFKMIFKKYHARFIYLAMRFVKDSLAAEDIVAESFIKIWQKRYDFNCLSTIESFLYTATKNACLNHIKQSNRHRVHHEQIKYLSEKSEEIHDNEEIIKIKLMQKILEDMEQLPPIRRKIFKMIYYEGLSPIKIAKILKISVNTVRVQKARAMDTIRSLNNYKVI
jgi:RNA polymerase sigma-70 factor (ECF subfamily)